jgi:DNA-binding CsgD family transcriptional regulator
MGEPDPRYTVGPATLTHREMQILARTAAGMTGPQVADNLSISPITVKTHKHRILARTGARTITEAVAMAFRAGALR